MGFDKSTGTTEYDMTVFLTPLGVEKFYNRGLVDGTKYFSIGDHDVNYICYTGLTYVYDTYTGGIYFSGDTLPANQVTPEVGLILNLRGTVDRDTIIDDRTLPTNRTSISNPVWMYSDPEIPSESILSVYKLSNTDKIFDKPIVLGSRNMWHSDLFATINNAEGFMYYIRPSTAYQSYTGSTEPTLGMVSPSPLIYTPFPGVSITNGYRSSSEIEYFYFLNKTNNPVIIDSFAVTNILPVTHTPVQAIIDENYSSDFVHIQYRLQWTAIKDGNTYIDSAINLYVPQFVYNKSRIVMFPYEVIRFGVSFEIVNPGSTIAHWHGQNYTDQEIYEGAYTFSVGLTAKKELDSSVIYTSSIDVVAQVKDSGYNPGTYITPVPTPSGGGVINSEGAAQT
jgi:hypothetical protein